MTHCKHCQRGIPLQHGIHLSELEMVKGERSNLALEPIERDTWHQPGKRKREDAPFVVGGEV
jgi:hypothetical protein